MSSSSCILLTDLASHAPTRPRFPPTFLPVTTPSSSLSSAIASSSCNSISCLLAVSFRPFSEYSVPFSASVSVGGACEICGLGRSACRFLQLGLESTPFAYCSFDNRLRSWPRRLESSFVTESWLNTAMRSFSFSEAMEDCALGVFGRGTWIGRGELMVLSF